MLKKIKKLSKQILLAVALVLGASLAGFTVASYLLDLASEIELYSITLGD